MSKLPTSAQNEQIIVIGGGPAGLMAAFRAAERGKKVLLLESTPRLLNKLRISGKGRCNVTNDSDREEFLANIARGSRFFRSAFSLFDNNALMAMFESWGVSLKTERGQRVFPSDDNAHTIADALIKAVLDLGVEIKLRTPVKSIVADQGSIKSIITMSGQTIPCGALVIATGGLSYPVTGSTGDGYRMASTLGHSYSPLLPSLAPIQTKQTWVSQVQGLSLRNVALSVFENGIKIFEKQGEMLFTHDGVSGPLVLSATAHMQKPELCQLIINLKPALDEQELDQRLQRELLENSNKAVKNIMPHLFPQSLCPVILTLLEIDPALPCNQVTKAQRTALLQLMQHLTLDVKSVGPIQAAVVTRGGISLDEVNPKTMQSKLVGNLYFAGEILDIDGYTGGFNLQIAFSTGYSAGNFCEIIHSNTK